MTKADLIDEVSKLAELTRKDSEVIVETIFDSIVRSLRVGDKIEIRGFGSFRTRQRKPRVGRNPKTGERVEVPAKKIPFFKPSKELKDLVNTGGGQTPGTPGAASTNARVGADASSAQPSKARLLSPRQNLDNLRRNFAILHSQPSNGHRQPKSPRPRAPRIEIQHSILRFRLGHMRVSINHNTKSRSLRLQIEFVQVVKNVDGDAADFEHIRGGNFAGPGIAVHVAANRGHRSNTSQLFQNGRIANVATMNDVVRSAQSGKSLGSKQAMGIGDNADDPIHPRMASQACRSDTPVRRLLKLILGILQLPKRGRSCRYGRLRR